MIVSFRDDEHLSDNYRNVFERANIDKWNLTMEKACRHKIKERTKKREHCWYYRIQSRFLFYLVSACCFHFQILFINTYSIMLYLRNVYSPFLSSVMFVWFPWRFQMFLPLPVEFFTAMILFWDLLHYLCSRTSFLIRKNDSVIDLIVTSVYCRFVLATPWSNATHYGHFPSDISWSFNEWVYTKYASSLLAQAS